MASSSNEGDLLHQAHVRLCRLRLWRNFNGLGLHLRYSKSPPQIINMIESNSPAAASGLRIWDVVLAVNYSDMTEESHDRVQKTIKTVCSDGTYVDLFVVEQKYYKTLKERNTPIDYDLATIITAPAEMPADFANFPILTPRICNLRLGPNDTAFGFTTVDGENEVGVYIQTVFPDTPASDAGIRKSDRIIEVNDRKVDKHSSEYTNKKIARASGKGVIKLLVADTYTYKYYMDHNMKFTSVELETAHRRNSKLQSTENLRSKGKRREHLLGERFTQFLSSIKRSIDKDDKKDNPENKRRYHATNFDHSYARTSQSQTDIRAQGFEDVPVRAARPGAALQLRGNGNCYNSNADLRARSFNNATARSSSLVDLRRLDQSVCARPPVINDVVNISHGTIQVCSGDITKQMVDAIVIASTSDRLRESVLEEAGDPIRTAYDTEQRQQTNKPICTDGGNLACQRIYFIPCPQMSQNADKWTFRSFISNAIDLAMNDASTNIQSIALPAIGCGQYSYDSNFVAKTLIMAAAYELEQEPSLQLKVYFVIQESQQKTLDAFRKELTALKSKQSTSRICQPSNPSAGLPPRPPKLQNRSKEFVAEKHPLNESSSEYAMVLQEFKTTMTRERYSKIVRIELIWNDRWYKQYMIHKEEFSQRYSDDTERHLFHGCSESAANSIINGCFNRSYAGQHGTSYGRGVYFSSKASYSHSYTTLNARGERCMFLAKVLIGKTVIGNSSTKVCPAGYDTTTDGSHIYVIYHDAQAFGHYLITYK